MVLSKTVLSIAVFTMPKILNIKYLYRLEYFTLKYLIPFGETKTCRSMYLHKKIKIDFLKISNSKPIFYLDKNQLFLI